MPVGTGSHLRRRPPVGAAWRSCEPCIPFRLIRCRAVGSVDPSRRATDFGGPSDFTFRIAPASPGGAARPARTGSVLDAFWLNHRAWKLGLTVCRTRTRDRHQAPGDRGERSFPNHRPKGLRTGQEHYLDPPIFRRRAVVRARRESFELTGRRRSSTFAKLTGLSATSLGNPQIVRAFRQPHPQGRAQAATGLGDRSTRDDRLSTSDDLRSTRRDHELLVARSVGHRGVDVHARAVVREVCGSQRCEIRQVAATRA